MDEELWTMAELDLQPAAPSDALATVPSPVVGLPELHVRSRSVEQLLKLRRLGIIMTPDRGRDEEAWGVLNPASARSREGELYLFPRVVAEGNYSRIAMAAARFDGRGDPVGVERLGLVLEPQEIYEFAGPSVGGVEDPRITFVPLLDSYVMTYTALGPLGARIALAVSKDLRGWERLGLLHFEQMGDVDFNRCDNKDCVIFPLPVVDPAGRPAFALLHRPIYLVPNPDGTSEWMVPLGVTDRRPSIWISYAAVDRVRDDIQQLTHVGSHQLLAQPIGKWEHHHIGSGAPPILSEEGWLLYYHGVVGLTQRGVQATPGHMVYQSGVMLLDRRDPRRILNRTFRPVLRPQLRDEQQGIVPHVVFPTAVDVRDHRIDVYYGCADERIAAATTSMAACVLMAPSAPPDTRVTQHAAMPALAQEVNGCSARNDNLQADVVTKPGPRRKRREYGHLLVCLDGSRVSERVLRSVEPLALKFGSRITLLRVVPAPDDRTGATNGDRPDVVSYLTAVQQRLRAHGLTVDIEHPEGTASDVILRRAQEMDVDVIALATHGRTGVDRMLLGSVAEEVVRRAPCPVLLERVRAGH
jgi:predicted GH43/DUF377 family glycosyl hydrolase/nucleotide-binding universal stress UspA family protein